MFDEGYSTLLYLEKEIKRMLIASLNTAKNKICKGSNPNLRLTNMTLNEFCVRIDTIRRDIYSIQTEWI